MSGHSHFKSIKHQKEIADAKKGQAFSKLTREITVAAKEKGGDPNTNPKLRLVMEKAKELNMPKENVERAIKKGTGELAGEKLEEITFEAFGPAGIAIIIEGITDNKNRAFGEIKQILNQNGGKIANESSVRWLFDKKGIITIDNSKKESDKEQLEMTAIEAGADDISWQDDILDIYTKPENLDLVRKTLEEKEIKIESASLSWVAKEPTEIGEKDRKSSQELFEALDENEAVQNIYSNLK